MMKTRLMKGRPRLIPPEDYHQTSSVNLWIDDKESDITSVSSATTEDDSVDTDDDSMLSDEDMEETENVGDETEDDDDDEDEDDDDDDDEDHSAMEQTIEPAATEMTEERTVANFDEVTPLFKAINGEEWDSVVTFLDTGSWGWKWSSLCAQLYQVSEKAAAAQVRTWVTANNKEGKGETTRLPLHAAIYKDAPFKVIQLLVKNYSKGVKNPDSEGNYPLHLAFERAATLEILTFLVKEFPEVIHLKNDQGKVPTDCGAANGISELLNLCIGATKSQVETNLTKEKGNLEEDRKQLLEVTKELMNLKKIVAERERNMTKDNFLYQKQHLSSAISQLTKLKLDLDKHEDNVLQHHLVAEKKRMDGVLGELNKTKGELDKIKSEKQTLTASNGNSPVAKTVPPTPTTAVQQKKKKKSKKPSSQKIVTNHHAIDADNEDPETLREESTKFKDITEAASPGSDVWSGQGSQLTIETDLQQDPEESRDPQEGGASPRSPSDGKSPTGQSPRKLKTVAARFKKKMNWRKAEKQSPEAE